MNNYRFIYLREKHSGQGRGFPIACIALQIDRNNNTVKYGVSTLHPDDRKSFNKEHGRSLAVGRLAALGKALSFPKGTYFNLNDIAWMVMLELQKDREVPTRTKRAIQRWLNVAAEADFKSQPESSGLEGYPYFD